MAGILAIFVLAGVLATVPARIDRWAVRNGASPETLAVLAIVTIIGIAVVPITFVICTGTLAPHSADSDALSVLSVSGLLLLALAAGRTTARMVGIRRRWSELSNLAAALPWRAEPSGVKVLPVADPLAFVSGTDAFVSQGLIDRLTAAQRQAVIEHEREHVQGRHARLLSVAHALNHGAFGLHPVSQAAGILDRELDVIADQAAARRLGDTSALHQALSALAGETPGGATIDPETQARIKRLSIGQSPRRPLVDTTVRLVTIALGALLLAAICLSIHAGSAWLGVTACGFFIAGFVTLTRPALKHKKTGAAPGEIDRA
jgi:hypothetical protein